ncbi:transmembrane protein [Citrus sinensis]|uniref:Transmembrane protein n=3 Tax=Citrus TaxID=2706 RepID=A0ACB8MUC0_CITSI|nr:putative UPF0481 protein At3g02645 isoform X1 [Citrus sinensis]KAH9740790.1 transmembrane protein [Citrus sinensis]KAH9789300.1 transmembrane protein [Citrus sinensis]KDO62945.1 hypothetical protein CISIN_1g044114mg [Citrus sinensis]GAY58125.1 hypothetical protein CUMW_184670 [Citrus unshiu]
MDTRKHEHEGYGVSIDMEKLADSLSGELESLHPLARECSIYRVPEATRCSHPSHFTPRMVSIGPFHHGKEELKAMEEHKKRYLKCFLQRTKVRIASFVGFIKAREAELRNCYAETIHLGSDEFIKMVLVDAVFLIELFLKYYQPNLRTNEDPILGKLFLYNDVTHEILLLENQLPLFILNGLFNLAKTETFEANLYEEISFMTITCFWFRDDIVGYLPIQENLLEINFSKAKHFVDLLILCLQPSQSRAVFALKDLNIPSVMELHQAGVKFKRGSSKDLLDIKFNEGILEIPFLTVYDPTERLYRNVLAFEMMHSYTKYLNDYIIMMNYLVSTSKDAELLLQNEIIGLGNTEAVPTVFRNLDKGCAISYSYFQYSGVVADLQAYCKLPWHKWKATLKQNYFNTPWASISVIAAVILLLLTSIQTVCSLIAL